MIVVMDKLPRENRARDARAEVGRVRLRVADLDRAIAFYRALGFESAHQVGNDRVFLTAAGSHPQIALSRETPPEAAEGSPSSRFSIRLADRAALAQALRQLTAEGVAITRAIDEGISESLYVRDPDGHDVELYYDRPRAEWPLAGDGTVALTTRPIDLDALHATTESDVSAVDRPAPIASMSDASRNRLREMRVRLLALHKALLEDTKTAYELDRGRIGSNASLLQLVINDPWFAWLHPLSELVVRIDETLQADAPSTDADGVVLLDQVERLLSPAQSAAAFAQRYYDALQRQPAVIVAHAEVRRILKQAK
jgi:catechol 2,3-dioxygenase